MIAKNCSPNTVASTCRPASYTRPRTWSPATPVANATTSVCVAIQSMTTVTIDAADVARAATANRADRDCGSHLTTVSRAVTCQGTNTGTCASTRSVNRCDGAKCGTSSSASTMDRASST